MEALSQHPTPKAIVALYTVLQEPGELWEESRSREKDADVRWLAAQALSQHLTPKAIDALSSALYDDDEGVQEMAVEALSQHLTPKIIVTLCCKLPHAEPVRQLIKEALEKTQDTQAVLLLWEAAQRWRDRDIWEALWRLSQRTQIWIDLSGQWHPLPPVEPAFQNMTERQ